MTIDRVPPQNPQAEQAVLGSMMLDGEAVAPVITTLQPDDFYCDAHRVIYTAMLDLVDRRDPVDLITVTHHLTAHGKIENIDARYLASLLNAPETAANVGTYMSIVHGQAQRRALITGLDLSVRAASDGADLDGLLDNVEGVLAGLRARAPGATSVPGKTIADLLAAPDDADDTIATLPLLGERGRIVLGWTHIIASPPKAGKTELLLSGTAEWAASGRRVLYFSEEGEAVWGHRKPLLRRWGAVPWDAVDLRYALGVDPAALVAYAAASAADIVIVDSARNLLGIVNELDNAEIARKIAPWYRLGHERGKTIMIAHHNRKAPGDFGEAIAGGYGFIGAVDVLFEIVRDSRQSNRRVLRGWGRVYEIPDLLYEKRSDGRMWGVGDPKAIEAIAVRRRLVDVIDAMWRTTAEINDMLDDPKPSHEQVRLQLIALAKGGEIERIPPIDVSAERRTVRWRQHQSGPVVGQVHLPANGGAYSAPPLAGQIRPSTSGPNLPANAPRSIGRADWSQDKEADSLAGDDVEGQRVWLGTLFPDQMAWIDAAPPSEIADTVAALTVGESSENMTMTDGVLAIAEANGDGL